MKDWIEKLGISDEADVKALEKYDSVKAAVEGGLNAQRAVGAKLEEQIKADPNKVVGLLGRETVLKALGAPEGDGAYDGIKAEVPETFVDSLKEQFSDEAFGAFKAKAKELGLLPSQVEGLLKWNIENAKKQNDEMRKAFDAAETAKKSGRDELYKEFGGTDEKFDRAIEYAKRAAKEFGGDSLVSAVEDTSNTALIKAMHSLAESKVAEGKLVVGEGGGKPDGKAESFFDYAGSMS